MALHQISHHFSGTRERASLPQTVHCGVVGSGDLEVLLEPKALAQFAVTVPAGVVELAQKQQAGYAYIRP